MWKKIKKPRKTNLDTPGSMNSLFGDFFREFWRMILGGVRDYLGGIWGGFWWKEAGNNRENEENYIEHIGKSEKLYYIVFRLLSSKYLADY